MPSLFKNYGKAASDLLKDDFEHSSQNGQGTFSLSTKASNGAKFSSEVGGGNAKVNASFKVMDALNIKTLQTESNGQHKFESVLSNAFVDGVNISIVDEAKISDGKLGDSLKLSTNYSEGDMCGALDVTFPYASVDSLVPNFGAPSSVDAQLHFNVASLIDAPLDVGVGAALKDDYALKSTKFGLNYSPTSDLNAAAVIEAADPSNVKGYKYSFSVHHKYNSDISVGSVVKHSNSCNSLAAGATYRVDGSSSVGAKFQTADKTSFGLFYKQQLNDFAGFTYAASLQPDLSVADTGFKFSFGS